MRASSARAAAAAHRRASAAIGRRTDLIPGAYTGPMRVYLIRHAHAVDAGPKLPDEARWLSDRGRKVARRVGKALAKEGVELDAVLTSPLVRAVQTAEVLAAAAGYQGAIEAVVSLSP